MKDYKWNTYIIFWLTQIISQLGSSMSSFALILWAYSKTQSAMSMSLMSFCNYLPYIVVSLFAGAFIDRHRKKMIILGADMIAALNTLVILLLLMIGKLELYHIYMVNAVTGVMNAFQGPATSVAIGIIVPEGQYEKASGMNSFSSSVLTVVTPMLATFIYGILGLKSVILVDLLSFIIAFVVLAGFTHIPEGLISKECKKQTLLEGCKEGWMYLKEHKGIWYLVLSMTVANLFSRIGYENILPALVLTRSGGDEGILALVTGFIGFGGIIGGIAVTFIKFPSARIKVIYFSTASSFLVGDILMGMSRNAWMWCFSAIATSVLIPFINAGINGIMYEKVPKEMQGRVFSVRNALQNGTIPVGILLGGYLADYVFEPFMKADNQIVRFLERIVGTGKGIGMAVMFLCTGILGALFSVIWYRHKDIRKLD